MRIVYLGNKATKFDNVAQTGLTWTRGAVHEVSDEKKAAKLIEHKQVWADADKEHALAPEIKAVESPSPRVNVVPQGGEETMIYWDPITIPVTGEVFKKLQEKDLETVFMTPADAEAFEVWKTERAAKVAQAEKMRAAKAAKQEAKAA